MSDNLKHDIDDEVTEQPSQVPVDSVGKLLGAAQPQGGVGDAGQVAVVRAQDYLV